MTITNETLMLAAAAAGVDLIPVKDGYPLRTRDGFWSPITDHAQLLDLAMALGFAIDFQHGVLTYWRGGIECDTKNFTPRDFTSLAEAVIGAAAEQQIAKETSVSAATCSVDVNASCWIIKYPDGTYNLGEGIANGFPVKLEEATIYKTREEAEAKAEDLGDVEILNARVKELEDSVSIEVANGKYWENVYSKWVQTDEAAKKLIEQSDRIAELERKNAELQRSLAEEISISNDRGEFIENQLADMAAISADNVEHQRNSHRWQFFACPQTALMLGSKLDPNSEQDWLTECNCLIDMRMIKNEL